MKPLDRALLACQRAYAFSPGAYTWEALQAVQSLVNKPERVSDGRFTSEYQQVGVQAQRRLEPINRRV